MTFEEFNNIFQTPFLAPWENDYYVATFENPVTPQDFLDYTYKSIDGLAGLWYHVNGNASHFIVPKGTVIPENFALSVSLVTNVPEKPIEVAPE